MPKVIQQSKGLNSSQELQDLIHCAESAVDTESDEDGWGSGLASILLLLHLIPPSPQGRKRPGKMSASQAEKHIVIFKKTGTNMQEHLDSIKESTQPYLLAVGTKKSSIHGYYIILDKKPYHASQVELDHAAVSSLFPESSQNSLPNLPDLPLSPSGPSDPLPSRSARQVRLYRGSRAQEREGPAGRGLALALVLISLRASPAILVDISA
ncbi:uncharacterized protein LOC122340417 [Puntigrus tetrazona]|uniref:uncharacterized protein LOC122340417 n=1 Tax=Puntigrus tetrazona TaxID=1606681 RepID=UPI001C8AC390|nr:uncharacterized protein LOC122340417 [Puntigrus tetrazona]